MNKIFPVCKSLLISLVSLAQTPANNEWSKVVLLTPSKFQLINISTLVNEMYILHYTDERKMQQLKIIKE